MSESQKQVFVEQNVLTDADKATLASVMSGFTADYSTEGDVTTLSITGTATIQIVQGVNVEGQTVFHSPVVIKDQRDLKTAIEYSARSLGLKAVQNAYALKNPVVRGGSKAVAEARVAALEIEREAQALEIAALRAQLAQQGIEPTTDEPAEKPIRRVK